MAKYLLSFYQRDIGDDVIPTIVYPKLLFGETSSRSSEALDREIIPKPVFSLMNTPKKNTQGCKLFVNPRRFRVNLEGKTLVNFSSDGLEPLASVEYEFVYPFRGYDSRWRKTIEHLNSLNVNYYYLIGEKWNKLHKLMEVKIN